MKTLVRLLVLVAASSMVLAPDLSAQQMSREQAERQGIDLPMQAPVNVPETQGDGLGPSLQTFLLIPESTGDRVMQFDPVTGDLINADFIPADPDNLSIPIQAILSSTGDSILVSDQLDDVVQEYDLQGNYLGVFAPAGGPNTAILDNIRGIALRSDGNLLVTVGGGANDDAIAMFDTAGNSLGNLVANGAGGLDSPFGIELQTTPEEGIGDLIIGGITSDMIHSYDSLTGNPISNIGSINTFPEQISFSSIGTEGVGNYLIANFSGTQEGIVEMDFSGTALNITNPASLGGYRGVYELPNGNFLVTNGGGVHEIDGANNLIETKVSGVSARFISEVTAVVPVELQSFSIE